MLRLAGFAALPYLGGLLSMHLELLVVLLLPVAVIAAVTSTFVKVILFGFGAVIYILGRSALGQLIPESTISRADAIPGQISGVIFLLACAAILLIQYARRWTLISRSVIAIAATLTLLIAVANGTQRVQADVTVVWRRSPNLSCTLSASFEVNCAR